MDKKEKARGCLLGGAIGDALGYQVEFDSYQNIISQYGPHGVTDLPADAMISDDTQMTLFTAEGLLDRHLFPDDVAAVHYAYLRWLKTQNGKTFEGINYSGGLMEIPSLHKSRAPGGTCLSALLSGKCGRVDHAINNSKGCGGVMRAAPCAFFDAPFQLGCKVAAITHSHPSGYLSAGTLAQLLHELLNGFSIAEAVDRSLSVLESYPDKGETSNAIRKSVFLAREGEPDAWKVEKLGGGWVGEEALAIAIYSALCYPDNFPRAVCLAVNHSGDSDSTGAICGNIMGMMLGIEAIPDKWLSSVELNEAVLEYADRLSARL